MANFPFLPGIPPLKDKVIAAGALLAATGIAKLLDLLKPNWGIYNAAGTEKVVEPDNFLGIDYLNSQKISDYPIEKGGFASYNKVQNPFTATVRISKGGSESDRSDFIYTIERLIASLDLYVLVTPERAYLNMSIERFDYRRDSVNGVGLIVVSLHMVEIREAQITTATASGGQVAGKPVVNGAPVVVQ